MFWNRIHKTFFEKFNLEMWNVNHALHKSHAHHALTLLRSKDDSLTLNFVSHATVDLFELQTPHNNSELWTERT